VKDNGSRSGQVWRDAQFIVLSIRLVRHISKNQHFLFHLINLTTSYSSYFGGMKGISRNKTSFFLLMQSHGP